MRDCHERDCIPDKAGTTTDGVIEGLLALISAFLPVDTDTFRMQGERITAPGFTKETFEKGGGCLRECNSRLFLYQKSSTMSAVRSKHQLEKITSGKALRRTRH